MKKLLDRGFREALLRQGFEVAFDALRPGLDMASSQYRLASQAGTAGSDRVAYVTPQDDGFVILVEVAGANVPREEIEKLREPNDGYSLVVFPPPIDGVSDGSWSLGELIGSYVWEQFPGWEAVIADETVVDQFVGFLVTRAHVLRDYVLTAVQRGSSGGDNSRELAFGQLQELINSPERIDAGEIPPAHVIEVFRRAFTAIPDAESYESLRMWIAGQAMREMSNSNWDGPWSSISEGVREFGKERGWYS